MKKKLPTLRRVADMRLVREQQRVVEAVTLLRTAEAQREQAETQFRAAKTRLASAETDFREKPQCDHRRHMLAVSADRLQHAQYTHACAEAEREAAQFALSDARLAELRAKTKAEMIAARIASTTRLAHDRAAELEGEDRWMAPLTV